MQRRENRFQDTLHWGLWRQGQGTGPGECAPPPVGALWIHLGKGTSQGRHQLPPGVLCGCSVTWRPALCDPMDCSTPGLPVPLSLLESTQAHVHRAVMLPTISSSAVPFSSHRQSFPASGSFPRSQLFPSGSPAPCFHRPQCKVS